MTRTRLLRIERGGLLLLVLLYILVAVAHTRLAPLTTGPDELAHYEYVNFIAQQGHLPATTTEREQAAYKSDQPPLYHLVAALPASLVDIAGPPHLKRYSDHERRPLIAQTRHAWGLYNTEDELAPYRGEILRWHIGRWVSILFGAATVIVTYFIAREMGGWPSPRPSPRGIQGRIGKRTFEVGNDSTPSQPPPARGRSQILPPSGDRGKERGGESGSQTNLSALKPRGRGGSDQIPPTGGLGGPNVAKVVTKSQQKGSVQFFSSRRELEPVLLALSAAAVVAFIPRFALTGSMLNYETMLAFFASLFLLCLLRFPKAKAESKAKNLQSPVSQSPNLPISQSPNLQSPISQSPTSQSPNPQSPIPNYQLPITTLLLLGLFAGLAITTKLSALILPLEIVIGLGLIARHYGWPWTQWLRAVAISAAATLVTVSWWFGFVLYRFNTVAADGWWTGLLRPLIAADASDATTNRLLSALTGGQAGFTAAIENLDSGPPWEWLATVFRTFWVVGIEGHQPLGWTGLLIALTFCLIAAFGLIRLWRSAVSSQRSAVSGQQSGVSGQQSAVSGQQSAVSGQGSAVRGQQSAVSGQRPAVSDQQPISNLQSPISNPPISNPQSPISNLQSPNLPISNLQSPNLPISQSPISNSQFSILNYQLLSLHLTAAFILPLIRYATTFSLADTAQGRHILFLAAPAFAILLVWGFAAAVHQFPISNLQLPVTNYLPFLPALFLLFWSLAQLYTMLWAYLPPLPVRTTAPPTEPAHPIEQPLNEAVTLLGYETRLDFEHQVVQVDLFWQATAVSPVDYLTEITLLNGAGSQHSQWLGHAAGGRYPTRAWDPGDIVRDTAWLPVGNLEPGDYSLRLNLLPMTTDNPLVNLTVPPVDRPRQLGRITLPGIDPFVSTDRPSLAGSAQAMAGYAVRQNGLPLIEPATFRYRETIIVTFNAGAGDESLDLKIVGPETAGPPRFAPLRRWDNAALFIVGPDWPTGNYRLQLTGADTPPLLSEPLFNVIDRWERSFTEPPLPYRLDANVADQVKLLGYDLPTRRVQPGGGLPLTLYWQGLDWMGQSYTIFARLLDENRQAYGGRDRLPREGYHTLYWAPGEIVTDPFGVPVDADAPDGIYYLHLGLYREADGQAVSLPLVRDGQPIDATSVAIGPIKIGDTPPGFVLDTAEPQVVLDQPFGDPVGLTLLGYDLAGGSDQPSAVSGQPAANENQPTNQLTTLTLYWRAEAPLPIDYTTFVHVRDAAGEIVAQQDQPPLAGAYPTSLWDPGEIIADEIILSLPADLPSGEYTVVVGLYDLATGLRLPVPGEPENSLTLTPIEVNR